MVNLLFLRNENECAIKMKKISFIIFTLFISISCKETNLRKNIISELNTSLESGKDKITFEKIHENFDSLLILRPYSNITKIGFQLNLNLDEIKNTQIDRRDDIILFVLLKNRKVICYTDINRRTYSSRLDAFKMYPKNYIFKLQRGKNSERELIIISD